MPAADAAERSAEEWVRTAPARRASEALDAGAGRREIKFVGPANLRPALEAWLRLHPAGFDEPYPARTVNNVYFDTDAYSSCAANLLGASGRRKLRLRWYGESPDPEEVALERKIRRGALGWKLSSGVGPLAFSRDSWREIREEVAARLAEAPRLDFLLHPLPVLLNCYRRRYYRSGDGRVRMTLDWDQRAFDQRLAGRPNLARRSPLPDALVVEVKFAPEDARSARAIVQGLPLRVSRHSKYVLGLATVAA